MNKKKEKGHIVWFDESKEFSIYVFFADSENSCYHLCDANFQSVGSFSSQNAAINYYLAEFHNF